MKILKIILIVIVVIVGGFFIWMATIDPNYDVNREIEINATPEQVWASIDDLTQWELWSPWGLRDSTMTITYGETTSGLGGSYSWTGDPENTGTGSMTISESIPNEYQAVDLVFTSPWESTSTGYFMLEPTDNGTRVIWGNKGSMPFTMRFMVSASDQKMGPNFEEGLGNLKEVVESKPAYPESNNTYSDAEVVDFPAIDYYYTLKENVPWESIGDEMGQGFGSLMANLGPAAASMDGMPFAVYTVWDEENQVCTFRCGVKITGDAEANDIMLKGNHPGGQAVQVISTGPYEGTGTAHMNIESYMQENEMEFGGEAWEFYDNDPTTVAPEEIITRVVYPIKG